jgi:gamma-glutamyltranspeptidase/glutathione hydrolase
MNRTQTRIKTRTRTPLLITLATATTLAACGGGSGVPDGSATALASDGRATALGAADSRLPAPAVVTPPPPTGGSDTRPTQASARVTAVVQVAERTLSPTLHEYDYAVTVLNGGIAQAGILARLLSAGAGVTVVDAEVQAGTLDVRASVTPADTITLRRDPAAPFDTGALSWQVSGTPIRITTFDPDLCAAQFNAPYGQTVGIAGTNVMVTSADVKASAAGCQVLARGGSAIDAAVAVQAVLAVVEPFASGLAGGSVITYWDAATKKVRTFDGLSRTPSTIGAATTTSIYQMAVASDLLCRSGQSIGGSISAQQGNTNISGRATGVPGTVSVLSLVHQAYGRTPWSQLFDSAIGYANTGYPMTKYMYSTLYSDGTVFDDETGTPLNAGGVKAWWNTARDRWGAVRCQYKDIKARYCDATDPKGEKPLPVGTNLTNPALAQTLVRVRDGGAAAFYDPAGPIAGAILQRFMDDKVTSSGANNCTSILPTTYNADGTTSAAIIPARIPSLMVAADFASYQAIERKPLVGQAFGMTIYTQPSPSFGGVVQLYSLGLLERKNAAAQAWGSPGQLYLASEASRLANADRRNIVGDPAYSNVNTRVAALLSPGYLNARAALINGSALGSVSAGGTADGIPPFAATDPAGFDPMASLSGKARPAAATRFARAEKTTTHGEDRATTSHLAVIDGYGNALSMTTTINTHWGAHIEAAGMMLNNALSNFSASTPGLDVNGYAANKRPRSSISPSIAFDAAGRVRLVWGSAGGGPIPDYIVKTFLGHIVYGLDIQAAINAPNWSGQDQTNSVAEFESGTPLVGLIPGMRSTYGYTAGTLYDTGLTSGLSGIAVGYDQNGLPVYRGAADKRRNGGANGY